MKRIHVRAYPYAFVEGDIYINDDVEDIETYIDDNFDEINWSKPDLDFCGTDFEWEEN